MAKRMKVDSHDVLQRVEELIEGSSSRYRITVQVAARAKLRRYENEGYDDPLKPIVRAIVEMSDELRSSEILGDDTAGMALIS